MNMINNKIFNNAKWIIGCRIVQSLIQLVVGMLSARYLGPSNYGLIHYASSLVAFAIPVMRLGLSSTLVQEYVERPEQEGAVLGTALAMNAIAAVASIIGVTAFAAVANPGETTTVLVCALYSVSLLAQSLEMIQCWFQAKLLSKYSSLAMLGAYILVSAYKIFLLITGKNVLWFALSHAVEYGATGVLLLLAYRKQGTQKLAVSGTLAKALISKSHHYISAALMVVVFNSTGAVLLKLLHGEVENGYFSAAMTCTSITGFVFGAIIDTARPVILQSKQGPGDAYERNVSLLYGITTWLSLAQSVCFAIFAELVIWVLYGESYLPAAQVLRILGWYCAFSYMGSVRNIWILAEQKHDLLFKINLGGAAASLALNACLIPAWGARGAALATVLTQIFTNVLMGFLLKDVRENNRLMLKGMNPVLLWRFLRQAAGELWAARRKKQNSEL